MSCEDYEVKLHKLNNADLIARFALSVRDKACIWLDGVSLDTPKKLKAAFIKKFSGVISCSSALEKWQKLTYEQEEDVNEYLKRIWRVAAVLDYKDQVVLDHFLMGLPTNIRVEAARVETLDECVTETQKYIDIVGTNAQSSVKELSCATRVSFQSQTPYREYDNRKRSRSRERDYSNESSRGGERERSRGRSYM